MKKFLALVLALVLSFSLTACMTSGTESNSSSMSKRLDANESTNKTNNPDDILTRSDDRRVIKNGAAITLTIGDTVIPATLNDSASSQGLISRLPYTISLQKYAHDFCAVMSDPLAYDEADQHDGWMNGDIDFVPGTNYFALLFNASKTANSPHVNLGKMDASLSFFDEMEGRVEVLIELAEYKTEAGSSNSGTDASALVIYYSYSGNTKRVSQRLADLLQADSYEIRTVKAYPDDPYKTADVSREERNSGNLPELRGNLPDITGYTTIYIGGPIWNSYTSAPLDRYLEITDFSGKTVVPFSTSMGSGQTGYLNAFKKRVQKPMKIAEYIDVQFPNNGSPDAFTNEEIDELLSGWLAGIGG